MAVRSLEYLLQTLWFGGDVAWVNDNLSTPLQIAASFGTPATVSVLLQARAAVNVKERFG